MLVVAAGQAGFVWPRGWVDFKKTRVALEIQEISHKYLDF